MTEKTPVPAEGALTVVDLLGEDLPAPDPSRDRGAVKRRLEADGAKLVTFTFAPGQAWPDHEAAHPIVVQCLAGTLDFTVLDDDDDAGAARPVRLRPGVVAHLPAHVKHRVDCPADAPDAQNVLLLTMLTGEEAPR